ncbi:ABC transporter permease [Jeotgalibaca ciconiae]|uniref:ABC transporter permease n=1 Tax=Jeotgalibaca ciconiae TaxID=2496265 RepID=A0A3Q9BKV4_9LACT|nr:ABC transporter permease [Jeotgalibaca ciconiae]AZP04723.1 ABC transporter permease [Jeotgalibaca ciconiae]HJB23915.1 ABC transporter permease [Candidatus Jeotgalibaca pullicola]
MPKYILKRIVNLLPTLFIVAIIIFAVTRIIPGNPAATLLGPQASIEEIEKMTIEMGLDKSYLEQFSSYLKNLLVGDLGYSYAYNMNVSELIMQRFPNTIVLTLSALLIALLIGIPAGIISAYKRNTMTDYIVMVISLVGVSMPVFWLGVMLVLVFSVNMGILPATGMGNWSEGPDVFFRHLILPSITLATIPMANFARITRSSMLEVLSQDYIRTARAKGLKEHVVIWKHALKNALNPILSVLGMQVAGLLGGSVLTETIFSWPGMGRLITDAIDRRDYGVVQGVVIFIALIYVLTNLMIDILYKVVNPKITYEGGAK